MVRFQVRKRHDQWETWALVGRSWQLLDTFFSYELAMILATGQAPYRDTTGWARVLTVEWVGGSSGPR